MKKILAMLMVSLILVCSMGAISVSAATRGYDLDVDGNGIVNIVIMGGYTTHQRGENIPVDETWHSLLLSHISDYAAAEDTALYGKTVNTYVLGSESETSVDGALKTVNEALALNADVVILDYGSDFLYTENGGTFTTAKSQEYYEKILLTLADSENVPFAWNLQLPNKNNTGYDRALHINCLGRYGIKNSTFIWRTGVVTELQSQNLSDAVCWDENGNLSAEGHTRIATALQREFTANWITNAYITQPVVADNGPYISGNAPVYGTFKAANTAVASEGFVPQADGSMVSTAADATLTFTLTGRTFGVVHDVAGADYQISIGRLDNYRDVDCSLQPVHYKEGYSNATFTVRIKANAEGVIIKGFYETPMTIDDAAYADGTVSATVLNSSLNTSEGDSAYAMVAYYDVNNKFVGFTPVTMTTAANNANKAAISAAALPGATKAKIMVWNSLESALPKCDATDYIAIN